MKISVFNPEEILEEKLSRQNMLVKSKEIISHKTVLGLDIYKYSEYPLFEQMFIPVIFNLLHKKTIQNCIKSEPYFFQKYSLDPLFFKKHFISTGDGGFQIFESPIEAIIFAIYFQLHIKRFNSGMHLEKLEEKIFDLIGRIELRYAITLDGIYGYGGSFYGPGIIHNARILSKDNLNRVLVDENIINWFDHNINSIENLIYIEKDNFLNIPFFKGYDTDLKTTLFENKSIKAVDILKIGNITSKNITLNIYNLHLQAGLAFRGDDQKTGYNFYSMTLGNINTKGIE
jgi:hypothetical protein